MNRKDFLSVAVPAGISLSTVSKWANATPATAENLSKHIPPYLMPGDSIGITVPAGFISMEDILPAVAQMESWGFKIVIGNTVGKKDYTFGGTDEERLLDFQQMLDNPEIQAIMCARGGYGAIRIIDKIDFTTFKRHPKWIIGFSDITVLHSHIHRQLGIATLHSKMCNSFPSDWSKAEPIQIETILSIQYALTGESMRYESAVNGQNRQGVANGVLVGGNLRTLENLSGTVSQMKTKNKILFVEDTGEYLYSIDRMFYNLKRTGMLDQLAGLIVGGFKIKPDDIGEEFGQSIYDIVTSKVGEFGYPVAFDFPVGHQRNNFALKCGVQHRLEVNSTGGVLTC